jgi:hypothetical protein
MMFNADARVTRVHDDGKVEFRAQKLSDDLPEEPLTPEAEI